MKKILLLVMALVLLAVPAFANDKFLFPIEIVNFEKYINRIAWEEGAGKWETSSISQKENENGIIVNYVHTKTIWSEVLYNKEKNKILAMKFITFPTLDNWYEEKTKMMNFVIDSVRLVKVATSIILHEEIKTYKKNEKDQYNYILNLLTLKNEKLVAGQSYTINFSTLAKILVKLKKDEKYFIYILEIKPN